MIERLKRLGKDERMLLLRLVANLAWLDGEVRDEERKFVRRLMAGVDLSSDETKEVESWLLVAPEEVKPESVPVEHKRLFVEAARMAMFVDGEIAPEEQAHFDRLRAALLG